MASLSRVTRKPSCRSRKIPFNTRRQAKPGSGVDFTYAVATSRQKYWGWSLGKRKSSEWQRGKQIKKYVKDNLRLAVDPLSTKQIIVWCRENGYGPPSLVKKDDGAMSGGVGVFGGVGVGGGGISVGLIGGINEGGMEDYIRIDDGSGRSEALYYCKFCGCPHEPAEHFKTLQTNCKKKHRQLLRINTNVPESELYSDSNTTTTTTTNTIVVKTEESGLPWKEDEKNIEMMNWVRGIALGVDSFIVANNGTENEGWEDQGRMAEAVLYKAAACFVRALVRESIGVYRDQARSDAANEAERKVLVPAHVYLGILRNKRFDFLTNCTSSGNSSDGSGSSGGSSSSNNNNIKSD
eukprot:TRINITY_DN469_c2_g2_i1.p1 TRINITY_DN469_c2_g2~~TRINITY_DN469_c2_g2_i1.p1  ORF type:complete len:351 (-),score=133.04 TRINITY_DN469_c2_g2_i1:64-1116(-)